ncbi:UNVERIFIED_CONTAM: HAD-IA family hydrolase [Mammaliicoccus sciuri]|uniref:HAD family hydrolase n=1 Tax=Mammaliicoccus sciuri TaxID=1296 RepID=UPI0018DBEEF9|nr:HAD-IA family hydrolase [Mammaliicoccus sciuri]MCJ1779561.1 HAD-IA family hydrolase [Mammaliicoccus sciuri]MEB6341358.1 HAD-IA family hydrolase [Mammaliicoccus sciuri]QPW14860.1 HAD-IA family hydrolase [Mammaliicoccus sciuri]
MYDAIIFDFDGTIIDTEINLFNTLNKHIEQKNNEKISLDEYKASIGSVSEALNDKILNALGSKQALEEMFEDHYEGTKSLPIKPVVKDLIEYGNQNQKKMGIATSSYKAHIMPNVQRLELDQYVDVIKGREDVAFVKPNPELYIQAAHDLKVEPEKCLAIEDTTNGAQAAIEAGMDVIVITHEITEDLNFDSLNILAKNIESEEIINRYL